MHTYSYLEEFTQALARTEAYKLPVPGGLHLANQRWLNPDSATSDVLKVVNEALSNPTLGKLSGDCVEVNYSLLPHVAQWLGCGVFYTLGWIDDGTQKGLFKFDDVFIEKMLRQGYKGGKERVHAWLTLPTMEIIDVTLAATYIATNDPAKAVLSLMDGMIMACHPTDFQKLRYKPMLVCNNLREHMGRR